MKKIRLKGGQIQYTDRKGIAYRVDEGSVLVYIVPFKDGRPGRRMFVGEIAAPEVVPCFCHSSELYGDWMFAIAAVDTAVIVPGKVSDTDAARERFAEIAGISTGLEGGFEEAVIEKYELKRVKEKGSIYFAKADAERVRNTSFRMIYDMLGKGKRWLAGGLFTATGDQLYDAASMLCRFEKIDIASLERIRITSGNKFRVEDIARVSHFVIREVVLTPGWNHRDNGALLVFTKDGARPLACIPDGPRRYSIYDPAEDSSFKLTDEAAAELSANAYMFYRPFPYKELTRMDIVRFGMQKVYRSDILRLFGLAILGTLVGLLLPYMNEQAFDKFIPVGNASGLVQLGAVLLACSLGNISFTIVKNLASFRSMNSMEYAVQSAVFDRLFNLPESFLRKYDAADLGQRAMGVTTIYTVLAQSAVNAALTGLFSLLYLNRMFRYSKRMSVWAIVLLTAFALFILLMGHLQIRYERKKREVDIEDLTQSR